MPGTVPYSMLALMMAWYVSLFSEARYISQCVCMRGSSQPDQSTETHRGMVLDLQQKNDEATDDHESLEYRHSGRVISHELVSPLPVVGIRPRRPLKRVSVLGHEVVESSGLEDDGTDPDTNQSYVYAQ